MIKRSRSACRARFALGVLLCWLAGRSALSDAPRPGRPVVENIPKPLLFYDGRRHVREPRADDVFPPLQARLTRSRYWAQDGHLGMVVQLADRDGKRSAAPAGSLRVRIRDASNTVLEDFTLHALPGPAFAVYPSIPDALLPEGRGEVHWVWRRVGDPPVEAREAFRVERFDEPVDRVGRVPLRMDNPGAVHQAGLPVTLGVPFPRGVLRSTDHLRLVDADGHEIPVQVRETARWSKFGTLKWVLCDFTVDLEGSPRELFLEYGNRESPPSLENRPTVVAPAVDGRRRVSMDVDATHNGFPAIDTGRLRFEPDGLWFDAAGDGNFTRLLDSAALGGAFVEHEDGRLFQPDPATPFEIEDAGPEKIVVRRAGWYVLTPPRSKPGDTPPADSDTRFCQYVTRFVIHRDSPFVRIFHTWIFTGDGNRDRIAGMGWRFDLADALQPMGFLESFDAGSDWLRGDSLVQWDYDHFDMLDGTHRHEHAQARAPGVAMVEGDGIRLHVGVKDFWQNYPSELEFRDGSLWFHNWPRHNRAAGHTFDKVLQPTRTEPAICASAARYAHERPDTLTRSEWTLNVIQLRYAHEGSVLDFRLPDVFGEPLIWGEANDTRPHGNPNWEAGAPESVNAQGISRTEEMWLYVESPDASVDSARALLQGLNDETLRAVVDPAWMALSGAFFEIHPQDPQRFPEAEHLYEQVALSPMRVAERLGVYGMWIHGDLPAWGLRLSRREPELYRAFRKGHLGWPYPWTPFARSGDSRFYKFAEAATRQMIDANWCHYVCDTLQRTLSESRFARRIGIWNTSAVPWAGGAVPRIRSIHNKVDFLMHAWYLTGYHRAWENLLDWAAEAKIAEAHNAREAISSRGMRQSQQPLTTFLHAYEATFDPWFVAASHAVADLHRAVEHEGRVWDTGDRDFVRFTGCDHYRDALYMDQLVARAVDPQRTLWNRRNPMYSPKAYAWKLTGDPYYLRRVAHSVEQSLGRVPLDPQPAYRKGLWDGNSAGRGYAFFTIRHLRWFPHALWALARAGEHPAPIYNVYAALPPPADGAETERRLELALRKTADAPLSVRLSAAGDGAYSAHWVRRLGPEHYAEYRMKGPGTPQRVAGRWRLSDSRTLELDAEAAPGDYRLVLRFAPSATARFDVPATASGLPEVVLPGENRPTPDVGWRSLWFRVPEGLERFTVAAAGDRAFVQNPNGKTVWRASADDGPTPLATISVPSAHSGRLWRVQRPGHFRLGPEIPPIYAVEPERWFDPTLTQQPNLVK